jgi:hypothetical protein
LYSDFSDPDSPSPRFKTGKGGVHALPVKDALGNIANLNGTENIEEVENFIATNETLHHLAAELSEQEKIIIATSKFRGRAQAYWREAIETQESDEIETWDDLIYWIKACFVDSKSQISAVDQLRKLSQEHLSICQYTDRFGDLTRRIGKANIPDWLAIRLYSTGLNNEIKKEIEGKEGHF